MVLSIDKEILPVEIENIPGEMKQFPHWIMWKAEKRGDRLEKVPYSPKQQTVNGEETTAKWNDKNIWLSFEEVKAAYQTGRYDGIGFFPNQDNSIYVLDIDGTTDHEYHEHLKHATYCEYSPSGNGIHVYMAGEKPKNHSKNNSQKDMELFSLTGFVTVTGHATGEIDYVNDMDSHLDKLIVQDFPKEPVEGRQLEGTGKSKIPQVEVIKKATSDKKRGEQIRHILNGDWEQATDTQGKPFPSQSESDQSLMNTLAFYSCGDSNMMYDIWCNSKAYRKEKDHKNGGIGKTIETAVNGLSYGYDPNYSKPEYEFTFLPGWVSGNELMNELQKVRSKELKQMEEAWIENGKNGRKPTTISTIRCAKLLKDYVQFALFDLEENTKLAMYVPDEGIYTQNSTRIQRIISWLEPRHNENKAKEVIYYLSNMADVKEKTNDRYLIPVENGVFNIKSRKLEPFNPDYVFTTKISTRYVESPKNPVINGWDVESWIRSIACNDEQVIKLLWQVINDSLNGNYTRKKSIFLIGEGNNGKGTCQELLSNLIGHQNVASLKVNEFDERFKLSVLEGKTAVIGDDVPANTYVDDSSNFNSVVTGDRVLVEFKGQPLYSTVFRCSVIQSTNGMPRFKNKTQGTLRRIIIVPFNADFNGDVENAAIKEDFIKRPEVLEYVLHKAINMDFEKFEVPDVSLKEMEIFKQDNDPVYEFKVNVFDEWDIPKVPMYIVYGFYKNYCEENGFKPLSNRKFHNEFKKHLGKEWHTESSHRFDWHYLEPHIGDLDRIKIGVDFPDPSKPHKAYERKY